MSYEAPHFIVQCAFEARHAIREKGFIWDAVNLRWYTSSPGIAAKLSPHCDEKAKTQLGHYFIHVKPWLGGISHPIKNSPLQFQLDAATWLLSRNRGYLAADPGTGKTIIAALVANAYADQRVVYITPPFLRANVKSEFEKWAPKLKDFHVVSDTKISKELVCNIDVLLVDEAHRFKSSAAKRTKALFKYYFAAAKRVYFLSGTPMPNRPMELYPVLHHAAPETIGFMSKFNYGMKYCGGYKSKWGWDFSGASNLKELSAAIKEKFMLRIKKSDVLSELPEKIEEMVVLSDKLPAQVAAIEKALLKEHSPEDLARQQFGDPHIATYRKLIGEAKCNLAFEFIEDVLENQNESVLVFAHHTSVIRELRECLRRYKPIVITGETSTSMRQDLVDEFQKNPHRRLFIGNIQAAGVGFTLTRASRVVFVEFSWVPAENEQASDRAHRIGQNQRVLVQYLIYKNSIDGKIMETILRKRQHISHL